MHGTRARAHCRVIRRPCLLHVIPPARGGAAPPPRPAAGILRNARPLLLGSGSRAAKSLPRPWLLRPAPTTMRGTEPDAGNTRIDETYKDVCSFGPKFHNSGPSIPEYVGAVFGSHRLDACKPSVAPSCPDNYPAQPAWVCCSPPLTCRGARAGRRSTGNLLNLLSPQIMSEVEQVEQVTR